MLNRTQFVLVTVSVMAMSAGLFFVMEDNRNYPNVPTHTHILYSKWRVKFGVLRPTPAEYKFRLTVFAKKFKTIQRLREEYPETKFSLNYFSDQTLEELKQNLLGAEIDPTPQTEQEQKTVKETLEGIELRASTSYRVSTLRAITSQLDCGSCWAFAGAALAETALKGRISISEQHIINCNSRGNACSGGNPYADALEALEKKGYKTKAQVPYLNLAGSQYCQSGGSSWEYKRARIRHDFAEPGKFSLEKAKNFVQQYNQAGAIFVNVKGDPFFHYSGGTFYPSMCSGATGNHLMNFVGWAGDINELRNSWGTGWGINGYMKVKKESTCFCGGSGAYCSFAYSPPK